MIINFSGKTGRQANFGNPLKTSIFSLFPPLFCCIMERNLASAVLPKRLQKTSAEQAILRSIYELEQEMRECEDSERREQINEQVSLLKDQLARLAGPDYTELMKENICLKEKVSDLEREISAMKSAPACASAVGEQGVNPSNTELKLKLYSLLLNRHKHTMSEAENKTVGEIKSLINPDDLSIRLLVDDFKPSDYSFERDYLKVAYAIYEFITSEVSYVNSDLDINFWLLPSDILAEKVGDDEDLAIMLCSLLYALGDSNAEVVIAELDDLTTHAFVITDFQGKFVLLDPSQKANPAEFTGTRKDVIGLYEFRGAKIKRFLYRFNRNKYEQFV